jgi:hypothetical protein
MSCIVKTILSGATNDECIQKCQISSNRNQNGGLNSQNNLSGNQSRIIRFMEFIRQRFKDRITPNPLSGNGGVGSPINEKGNGQNTLNGNGANPSYQSRLNSGALSGGGIGLPINQKGDGQNTLNINPSSQSRLNPGQGLNSTPLNQNIKQLGAPKLPPSLGGNVPPQSQGAAPAPLRQNTLNANPSSQSRLTSGQGLNSSPLNRLNQNIGTPKLPPSLGGNGYLGQNALNGNGLPPLGANGYQSRAAIPSPLGQSGNGFNPLSLNSGPQQNNKPLGNSRPLPGSPSSLGANASPSQARPGQPGPDNNRNLKPTNSVYFPKPLPVIPPPPALSNITSEPPRPLGMGLNNNGVDSAGKNIKPGNQANIGGNVVAAKIPTSSVSRNLDNNLPPEIAEQYGGAYGNRKSTGPLYGNNTPPSSKIVSTVGLPIDKIPDLISEQYASAYGNPKSLLSGNVGN